MGNRQSIHALVDRVPDSEVEWVRRALELVVMPNDNETENISALLRAGELVGCLDIEDGPTDLSTNPVHMDPFGQ
jgi:hypothetical protein